MSAKKNEVMSTILPEEVWRNILKELNDPKDLVSCNQTCRLFEEILRPTINNWNFCNIFPMIFQHLDAINILKCRSICKDWNASVDDYLENHPSQRSIDVSTFNPWYPPFPLSPMKMKGMNLQFSNGNGDMREMKFLEKMRDHPRNPFVGRAVTISVNARREVDDVEVEVDDDGRPYEQYFFRPYNFLWSPIGIGSLRQQEEQFWRELYDFLKKFGKHIWYLKFDADIEESTIALSNASRQKINRFLTRDIYVLIPNIKGLQISGGKIFEGRALASRVNLASPASLETLRIDNLISDLDQHLLLSLVRDHCKQLRRLHVHWVTLSLLLQSDLEWSNLRELYITEVDDDQLDYTKSMFRYGLPQLRKLSFESDFGFRLEWKNQQFFISRMTFINGFASTHPNLRVLRLNPGFIDADIEQTPDLCAAASVTTLEVEQGKSYNFLLKFPSLQILNVVVSSACDEKVMKFFNRDITYYLNKKSAEMEKEVVQVTKYMFSRNMYKSNIWQLLPRLQVFTFQWDVYTRQGFEMYLEDVRCKKKIKLE